jgi:tRNA(Ile)-lysidine synthetase-like protein
LLPCPTVEWPATEKSVELGADAGHLALQGQNPVTPDGRFAVNCRTRSDETTIHRDGHHKSLKNLFQSAGIPTWLRDCIPLCTLDGKLVAMGDWCLDEHFANWLSENHTCLIWRPHNPLLKFLQARQSPEIVDP